MAASATPPGVVDPTKLGKYPVILSDALRGESPKEILTAIRCELPPRLLPSILTILYASPHENTSYLPHLPLQTTTNHHSLPTPHQLPPS